MSSNIKKIDTISIWEGVFETNSKGILNRDGTTSPIEYKANYTINKIEDGFYKITRTVLSPSPRTEDIIAIAFKYCNGDRQLLCQSTNDVETLSLFATDNRNIIQNFQYTINQMKDKIRGIPDVLVFGKGKRIE